MARCSRQNRILAEAPFAWLNADPITLCSSVQAAASVSSFVACCAGDRSICQSLSPCSLPQGRSPSAFVFFCSSPLCAWDGLREPCAFRVPSVACVQCVGAARPAASRASPLSRMPSSLLPGEGWRGCRRRSIAPRCTRCLRAALVAVRSDRRVDSPEECGVEARRQKRTHRAVRSAVAPRRLSRCRSCCPSCVGAHRARSRGDPVGRKQDPHRAQSRIRSSAA